MEVTGSAETTRSAGEESRGERSVAGRDARLPPWMAGAGPRPSVPRFDSVVVCGNGVGALVCATRLARSEAFAGRVTVAAAPATESRRLIGGLTLRARSLDYYCAAFACERSSLLGEMFGDRAAAAETRSLCSSLCERDGAGRFALGRTETWMRSVDHRGRVLAYGVRNSGLVAALRRSMADLDVAWHPELPSDLDDCREIARGERPVVVDASGGTPLAELAELAAPTSFVLASQLHFTAARRETAGVLDSGAAFLGVLPRGKGRGLDAGVYNPVVDPLTPKAAWYGIVYRIVRTAEPLPIEERGMRALVQRYEAQLSELLDEVVGVGEALGLEPLDEAQTLGQAVVSCQPWRDVRTRRDDVVELSRIYDACAPIITGDGMARSGLAALVVAECLLAGVDPALHANRALRLWRRTNRAFALGMTSLAPLVAWGARRYPKAFLDGGRVPDTWAGLE
jgi:hypothetical protein